MSISTQTVNSILDLIFSATTWSNYADNATVAPETAIAVALHTADPGDSGTMQSNEVSYANYARQAVARSTGWTTAASSNVSPTGFIAFPASAGAGATITHFSTGKSGAGAAPILWSGAITPAISITAPGITVRLSPATTIMLD